MTENYWTLTYTDNPTEKKAYGQQSLLSLGNGFVGWRGAPIFSTYNKNDYPGLYLAGVFNQTTTKISGRDVVNEDMVNMPNPQLFEFYLNNKKIDFEAKKIKNRFAELNMQSGTLTERYTVKTDLGDLILQTNKIVDPINYHLLGITVTLVSDFDADLKVVSLIDGTVQNQNVERYRDFDSQEFDITAVEDDFIVGQTRTTNIQFVLGARTYGPDGQFKNVEGTTNKQASVFEAKLLNGQALSFEKVISIATSLETNDPSIQSLSDLNTNEVEDIAFRANKYWQEVWDKADVKLYSDDNPELQRMIRLNIFHIHQAAQANANKDLDASVGSRGLTGEGYRGHVFWDELFLIPYYSANAPQTAKQILQYRINRLEAAKKNAIADKEIGAMFPWQSGMTGDEQAQLVHLNTVNNEWEPDNSRFQRHVSLAVVYDIWIYSQITGDNSLLNNGGLEVLLETTKFWLNKVTKDSDDRYHLSGVMGPDEFHEAYPDSNEPGVEDNAYTNIMLAWSLDWLLQLETESKNFSEVAAKTGFNSELTELAKEVSKRLSLTISDDGVVAQFKGFFELKEVDFEKYEKKYGDIHRIDRLLKAEGLSPDEYKAIKQTDFLMLLYTLGELRTKQIIDQLGYELPSDWLKINKDYYLKRTVHGSTTSRPVFAGIDVRLGNQDEAVDFFTTAIGSDYFDIQGGTTAEGIHLGVMGETLEVVQNEFGGVDFRDGNISINPNLPLMWESLIFKQRYKNSWLSLVITKDNVTVTSDQDISAIVFGKKVDLKASTPQTIERW